MGDLSPTLKERAPLAQVLGGPLRRDLEVLPGTEVTLTGRCPPTSPGTSLICCRRIFIQGSGVRIEEQVDCAHRISAPYWNRLQSAATPPYLAARQVEAREFRVGSTPEVAFEATQRRPLGSRAGNKGKSAAVISGRKACPIIHLARFAAHYC